jgi:cellulose synthase/poly-beta-1,6-N-acetylglucosamine synthase-like glycosyltransferase
MNDLLLHLNAPERADRSAHHQPLGTLLVDGGKIAQKDLAHALNLQSHIDAPLGDIMVSEGLVTKKDVLSALARQCRAQGADLELDPPHPGMARHIPASLCLRHGVVPWKEDRRGVYVATSSPGDFNRLRRSMGPLGMRLFPVIVDEAQIQSHLSRLYGPELARKAAERVPAVESCRGWAGHGTRRTTAACVFGAFAFLGLVFAPAWVVTLGVFWAVLTLVMTTSLKGAAFFTHLTRKKPVRPTMAALRSAPFRLPRVSILVPLLREKEIAGQLIARLSKLTYPKSLLNVVLVLEEGDELTRKTIARTELPDWMSVIEVPEASDLQTKPRALNYALDFCKGSIIGVWDAEDWPEADQIERVAMRFNDAPPHVACLQGVLDYYNSRTNWLSRCFSIEYATWWRIVLPGVARMGLVIPLGGTTLFFRRQALEKLGGWDAHNVTEDADLGVRLARHGYVTELLPTVTHEEATCRVWPWVRQRSRWLKGFLVTYFVHMRNPAQLLRDLGFWRFLGVQTMFLATFSQFIFAPFLWSFWLVLFGASHPVTTTMGQGAVTALIAFFLIAEAVNLAIAFTAVSGVKHRHLLAFVPTMILYFTLGTVAAYKALWEIIHTPFFWDKTQHGVSRNTDVVQAAAD